MTLQRLLVLGSDAAYFKYTVVALRSFLAHNPGWDVLVMDVGLAPDQVRALEALARVEKYPREAYRGPGSYIPSARARCQVLARLPTANTLMLYLDGDTVTLGSVEPLVEEFLASGCPVGLAPEDDPRFFRTSAGKSWVDGRVPIEFPRNLLWYQRPMLNTGVLLAVGPGAAAVGERALVFYERLKDRFRFAEQTILNAVVYEEEVRLYRIPLRYHCFVEEKHLSRTGRPYIEPMSLDGVPVVIRHFCHQNKAVLDSLMPALFKHYAGPPFASGPEATPLDGGAANGTDGKPLPPSPTSNGPGLVPGRLPSEGQERAAALYLDLLKRCLTNWLYGPTEHIPLPPQDWLRPEALEAVRTQRLRVVRHQPMDPARREVGRDWPPTAHTMIGKHRLDNLQHCVETVLREHVPGDLLEAGVWRGGAALFLRAILQAYGVTDRVVWAADSFAGLPAPSPDRYPADRDLRFHTQSFLAVSLEEVRGNFERYGLLDDQVRFLKGWFKDTLPTAPIGALAVLRLDGDMYESTTDALTHLYPKVSPGGFVIVDDYHDIAACRQAVDDYRQQHGIGEPLIRVDWTAVYWRRQ